jgi:mono/diheme cytochrome c family protein
VTYSGRPLNPNQYAQLITTGQPADAYLRWKSQESNTPLPQVQAADAAMSVTADPFKRSDEAAVQMGRSMYVAHCATCHGVDADGHGQVAGLNVDRMSFHNPHKSMYITLFGHAPASWFTTIQHGAVAASTTQPSVKVTMPAFENVLAREQIWLLVTYLEQETVHPGRAVTP